MISAISSSGADDGYRDPHDLVKVDPKFKQMGDDAYAAFVAGFKEPYSRTAKSYQRR
jgi:hypothetical protein